MIMYMHNNDLQPGKVIINGTLSNINCEWDTLTFRVVKEVTREDYLSYLDSIGYDLSKVDMIDLYSNDVRVFEIQAD